MNDFIQMLLSICGGISIIGAAVKLIFTALSPYKKLVTKVDDHEELLKKDNERLKRIEESNKLLVKGQMVLIEHLVTGDHIDKLEETQKELQDYLVNR